jgi:hypothetical protein
VPGGLRWGWKTLISYRFQTLMWGFGLFLGVVWVGGRDGLKHRKGTIVRMKTVARKVQEQDSEGYGA